MDAVPVKRRKIAELPSVPAPRARYFGLVEGGAFLWLGWACVFVVDFFLRVDFFFFAGADSLIAETRLEWRGR